MSIDDKSLWIGIAIGIVLPLVCTVIGIAVSKLIEKIRDSIASRQAYIIINNIRICELEAKDDERTTK